MNPLDLIYGRISTDVEYAFYGPLSAGLGFQYIFAEPGLDRQLGVKGDGYGVYGELGFWIEGRPLRGFFLKGRVGHSQVTVYGLRELAIPQTRIGALFGSQSIYGGWFTLTYGLGVSYDTQSKDRMLPLRVNPTTGREESVIIEASGIFGNGWDLITMVAIGGSF